MPTFIETYSSFVKAKREAEQLADNGGITYHVFKNPNSRVFMYGVAPDHDCSNRDRKKAVYTVEGNTSVVRLTKEEKELVYYILTPDDTDEPCKADTPEVRRSLWQKIGKALTA